MKFCLSSLKIYAARDRRFVYAMHDAQQAGASVGEVINLKSGHISLSMLFFEIMVFNGEHICNHFRHRTKIRGQKGWYERTFE